MNVERLSRLADLIERTIPKMATDDRDGFDFNMSTWGRFAHDKKPEPDCGTTACALGLAAISGEFADAGLMALPVGTKHPMLPVALRIISTNGNCAMAAAQDVFDIDDDQAQFLFLPSEYDYDAELYGPEGARTVVARIREFIASGGETTAPVPDPDF